MGPVEWVWEGTVPNRNSNKNAVCFLIFFYSSAGIEISVENNFTMQYKASSFSLPAITAVIYRAIFLTAPPNFITKKKTADQPITAFLIVFFANKLRTLDPYLTPFLSQNL